MNNKSQKHTNTNCYIPIYYFEALRIDVNTSGYYMFSTESSLDTFGYLYKHQFDPYSSNDNSFTLNDDFCEELQFAITAYLEVNITYVLVITIVREDYMNEQGPFCVIAKGPERVYMKRTGMY